MIVAPNKKSHTVARTGINQPENQTKKWEKLQKFAEWKSAIEEVVLFA